MLGPGILNADGTLDRAQVAAAVFHDAALRRRYNDIVHPAIMQATLDALSAADEGDRRIVVHDIPLLSASTPPLPWRYDVVVTVEAAFQERVRRLMDSRGYSRAHAFARIEAQGSEEGRAAIADVVVRPQNGVAFTIAAADELWQSLLDRRADRSIDERIAPGSGGRP